jgi:putative flippase GtrA
MLQPVRTYSEGRRLSLPRGSDRRRAFLQLARFGINGVFVFLVYTGSTLLMSDLLGIPIVVAIALAYVLAIVVNFTMQRHFVFLDHDTFALPARSQLVRYVGAALCTYGLTALVVSTVPQLIGVSQQVVFVGTVIVVSLLSFTLIRGWIFHPPSPADSLVDVESTESAAGAGRSR